MRSILVGFITFAILAIPAVAADSPPSLEELLDERASRNKFQCGKEFITLPVLAPIDGQSLDEADLCQAGIRFKDLPDEVQPQCDLALSRVWMTVRKSDVIGIAARGNIDTEGKSRGVRGRIAIKVLSAGTADLSREIHLFGLYRGTYDDIVDCLN